jgi:hypothetical protein
VLAPTPKIDYTSHMTQQNEIQEGQKVIINGKSLIVTEAPDILQGFWAMDSDSNEDEYHTSQIEMAIKK